MVNADRGQERLWLARSGIDPQPLCEEGHHRPSDAELRCLSQIHRGWGPEQAATGSKNRWQARPAPHRAGECKPARRSVERIRFLAGAAPAFVAERAPADQSQVRTESKSPALCSTGLFVMCPPSRWRASEDGGIVL